MRSDIHAGDFPREDGHSLIVSDISSYADIARAAEAVYNHCCKAPLRVPGWAQVGKFLRVCVIYDQLCSGRSLMSLVFGRLPTWNGRGTLGYWIKYRRTISGPSKDQRASGIVLTVSSSNEKIRRIRKILRIFARYMAGVRSLR